MKKKITLLKRILATFLTALALQGGQTFAGCCFSGPINTLEDPAPSEQETENSLPRGCIIEGDTLTFTGSRVTKEIENTVRNHKIKVLVFKGKVTIGYQFFTYCRILEKVVFERDANLGKDSFKDCENLVTIVFKGKPNISKEEFEFLKWSKRVSSLREAIN